VTRQERREQTRAELLGAAAEVFGRRGYHDASVEEIAAEAGYSTGALYSNFANKEHLFLALADHEVARRVDEIRAVGDLAERAPDPAAEACRQFQLLMERNPEWSLLLYEFRSFGVRDAALRETLATRGAAVHDALEETLERLTRLGIRLRHPAPVLATALGAALNGLAFERASNPDALPHEVFAEFVAAVLAWSFTVDEQA
jgi:AcrR family transcriptional regulator